MKAATYSEKLRDPRWQKKRLEILNAAEWRCEECGEESKELHVHHALYIAGRDPWDYDNTVLMCLCAECHEGRGILETQAKHWFAMKLRFKRPDQIQDIIASLEVDVSGYAIRYQQCVAKDRAQERMA